MLLVLLMMAIGCTTGLPTIEHVPQVFPTPAPTPTPTPTPDPWMQAVADAQSTLADADLEAHFQFYQDTTDKIDAYLAQLEKLRPALKLFDTLKTTELPLVGNAWNLIIKALDKAFLGAGTGLEQVDEGLRDLLDSHHRLQRVDELNQTLDAVHVFEANPSRQTLEPMGETMARADFILAGVDKDATAFQDKVTALLSAITKVQQGLGLVSGLTPQLQGPMNKIRQFIDELAAPVQGLADTLATLRAYIAEDRDLFWRIQDIIEKAKHPPGSLSERPEITSLFRRDTCRVNSCLWRRFASMVALRRPLLSPFWTAEAVI